MKWPEVEIGKVANVESGFGFPREFQGVTNEEFPFFKVGDMNLPGNERCMKAVVNTISTDTLRKIKAKTLPKDTIIFPKIGAAIATNKKRILAMPSVVDNNVMGLVPTSHVEAMYLFYWMQQFDLRRVSNIGPVPSMRKSEVEKILIPLPTLSEQRRIVKILDQADALCMKRAQADAIAARILPTLFYRMFGDPATNPKGWEKATLGDVIIETQYGTSVKAEANGDGITVIRMNNIETTGRMDLTDLKYAILSEDDQQHYALNPGDLLFNRTNSKELVGKTGLWRGQIRAVAASYLIRVRVDLNQVRPEYVWAFMNSRYIKQILYDRCRHAIGMANINAKEIRALPMFIPPKPLQDKFASLLAQNDSLRVQIDLANENLNSIYMVLIQQAFAGGLTAKWREAHMEELLAEMEEQARAFGGTR